MAASGRYRQTLAANQVVPAMFTIGWIRRCTRLVLAIATLCLLGYGVWLSRKIVPSVSAVIVQASPWLALWRSGLFIVIIAGWPFFARRIASRYVWSAKRQAALLALRWRFAAWLLLLELLLVQNIVGRFVQTLLR